MRFGMIAIPVSHRNQSGVSWGSYKALTWARPVEKLSGDLAGNRTHNLDHEADTLPLHHRALYGKLNASSTTTIVIGHNDFSKGQNIYFTIQIFPNQSGVK
jgi:hypothetical protein